MTERKLILKSITPLDHPPLSRGPGVAAAAGINKPIGPWTDGLRNYALNFLLMNTMPVRPELKRSNVPGSGTCENSPLTSNHAE